MADEEVVVASAASPVPSDHKRKLSDFEAEPEADPDHELALDASNAAENDADDKADATPEADSPDAKRARLDGEKPDGLASENGHQVDKIEESVKESDEQAAVEGTPSEEVEPQLKEINETVTNEQSLANNIQSGESEQPPIENTETQISHELSKDAEHSSVATPQQIDDSSAQDEQPPSGTQSMSRKMEVPNNKVGVLIGKAGETIRLLQHNSGAKIQITRDADADPHSTTRSVELIGTLENITKAERLIKDVITEADAGGSPSLVARGLASAQATGAAEQFLMPVPNEKVGLIIGRGGETIKGLQTKSGARIQLIPQHLPEGDESKERTVRVTGDKKQIEIAIEMIKEVMSQTVRLSSFSSGFNQQGYRPRGPSGPSQWGPRGPHPSQSSGYDYQHRGSYPSNPHYPPPTYGNYPSQQMGPRSGYGSGWEQRPPASMQGPPQGGGYDYYGGHADHPASGLHSAHGPGHGSAPAMVPPQSQAPYNYGQPAAYSQTGPQQAYGHGYDEPKYENQAQAQHYGGHGTSQPVYPGNQPGYAPQQQYGKPTSYGGGMASQGQPPQSFGPRASQPGDMPYQGPNNPAQSYGQNVASQQPYPYAPSGPTQQQTYPPYGSAPATADGYNQQPPASGAAYPQQAAQPVQGYGQPGGQQAGAYSQMAPAAGYGQYPAAAQGYLDQTASNNAGYGGYQAAAAAQDPAYNSGPGSVYGAAAPAGGYAQPVASQPGYDQSAAAQTGGYGGVQGSAPVGYGKSLSPQTGAYPPYDATAQIYGATQQR